MVLIWVFYCIPLRDLLAKLNIKHRMSCNKPIDYKMLTKFFVDIIAWLYREGGNSHIYNQSLNVIGQELQPSKYPKKQIIIKNNSTNK